MINSAGTKAKEWTNECQDVGKRNAEAHTDNLTTQAAAATQSKGRLLDTIVSINALVVGFASADSHSYVAAYQPIQFS